MELIQSTLTIQPQFVSTIRALHNCPLETTCFFDIETTGLSADISSVYLIGCLQICEDSLKFTQWFADDYVSEKELLSSFTHHLTKYTHIIHYNGTGFDLPYLKKKYEHYQMENPFANLHSIDLYKEAKKLQTLLPLKNYRLVSAEHFFGFSRNDSFSGKDCIELYMSYTKNKYSKRIEERDQNKNALLLHNHDDLLGTFYCSQIFSLLEPFYSEEITWSYEIKHEKIIARTTLTSPVPVVLSKQVPYGKIYFEGEECILTLSLFHGIRYYFYHSPKDYYYLPDEDMAIHKSVAIYTDSAHREKATKSNCYTKKNGQFLILPDSKKLIQSFKEYPLFYNKDKTECYIEWTGSLPIPLIQTFLLKEK